MCINRSNPMKIWPWQTCCHPWHPVWPEVCTRGGDVVVCVWMPRECLWLRPCSSKVHHDLPLVPKKAKVPKTSENISRRKESVVASDFEQFSGQPAPFDHVFMLQILRDSKNPSWPPQLGRLSLFRIGKWDIWVLKSGSFVKNGWLLCYLSIGKSSKFPSFPGKFGKFGYVPAFSVAKF